MSSELNSRINNFVVSKRNSKSQTLSINEIKNIITRDIEIGSLNDNLSKSTITTYTRQIMRIYKAGVQTHQWTLKEFTDAIQYPAKFDDVEFQKTFKVQNSIIIQLLRSIYTSKESLITSLNALCKMVKNRYRGTLQYYSTIRTILSKLNKKAKLDNELTPEEEAKYISYSELMSIPDKVKKVLTTNYGKVFISQAEYEALAKSKRTEYLKSLFDYMTLYLNVHYPLRLVWPSVFLTPEEGTNYLQGNDLLLKAFGRWALKRSSWILRR